MWKNIIQSLKYSLMMSFLGSQWNHFEAFVRFGRPILQIR